MRAVRFSAAPLTSLLVVAMVAVTALPAGAERLWTERGTTRAHNIQLPSISPLVSEVKDAVLTISTEAVVENTSARRSDPRLEFFRRFGIDPDAMPMPRARGQGTGFLIHPGGYALTNNHVIEGAGVIKVNVGMGKRVYEAEVIGADPGTDVALIKLKGDRRDWPVIPLGNSDELEVGDFVVAIGNPFGLSQSVSMGIISARGRRDIAPSGRTGLYDFLQTDASINPGNSGGPLINLKGEVIGINTAINAAGQGIGFAIPANLVKQLIPELKENGRVSRSWIGVGIRQVTPELAEGLGLDRPRGALVAQVVPDGPGAAAGIEPGDVIIRFDGKPIDDASELPLLAGLAGVGRKVDIELVREGRARSISLKLGQLPGSGGGSSRAQRESEAAVGKVGLAVEDLSPDSRQRLGLEGRVRGAHVVQVAPGSPAMEAGIQPDDVIVEVNGKKVRSAQDVVDRINRVPAKKLVRVLLQRGDATIFAAFVKP